VAGWKIVLRDQLARREPAGEPVHGAARGGPARTARWRSQPAR
jgi:hypothetical protein